MIRGSVISLKQNSGLKRLGLKICFSALLSAYLEVTRCVWHGFFLKNKQNHNDRISRHSECSPELCWKLTIRIHPGKSRENCPPSNRGWEQRYGEPFDVQQEAGLSWGWLWDQRTFPLLKQILCKLIRLYQLYLIAFDTCCQNVIFNHKSWKHCFIMG